MKQTLKFRANPTSLQKRWLFSELRHQKELQNYMFQMRSQMWEYGSISVSLYDQINHLAELRQGNTHYCKHPQDMRVSTIKRVDVAHNHFFRRCQDGSKKKGSPRYKRSVRR